MGKKYASDRKLPHADEVRHAQPETRSHRARKDRKRWCRGKPGVEHTPEVVVAAAGWMRSAYVKKCHRPPWKTTSGRPLMVWICNHQEVCTGCGRILRAGFGKDCPDYVKAA
jgi:hypothetical protein